MNTKTYLAVDELDILRALRVTVTGTELGSGLVVGELGHTTVLVHLDEVDSTVKTAREVGDVDVETEFLVHELEHLVVGLVLHEVNTRSDVGASHELESEGVATGGDTVSAGVVSTVKSTVICASGSIWAKSGVPGVSGVAVGVTTVII